MALCLIPILFILYLLTVKRIYGEFYKRASEDYSHNDVLKYQQYLLKSLRFYPFHFQARYSLANTYMYTGQYESALAQIREAEKTGNLPVSGYKAQGTILLKTGDLEEAFRSFEKAFILSPDNPETLEYMAFICILREKYSAALYYLDRATTEDPVRPNCYYLYGKIYETWKQDAKKAKDYYSRALQYYDPKTKLIFNPADLKK